MLKADDQAAALRVSRSGLQDSRDFTSSQCALWADPVPAGVSSLPQERDRVNWIQRSGMTEKALRLCILISLLSPVGSSVLSRLFRRRAARSPSHFPLCHFAGSHRLRPLKLSQLYRLLSRRKVPVTKVEPGLPVP